MKTTVQFNAKKTYVVSILSAAFIMSGCASKVLQYDKTSELEKNNKFDNNLEIVIPDGEEATPVAGDKKADSATDKKAKADPKKEAAAKKAKVPPKVAIVPVKPKKNKNIHEPADVESGEGFVGRRPIKDPFRVGEKVIHDVTYLAVTAGQIGFEVRKNASVNGRPAYNLWTTVKTGSMFSSFYSVDDYATTLMDIEEMIPSIYTLRVRESGQIREARALFDFQKNQAKFWEKKITKKDGEEEKNQEWEILPYSQNVYSLAFYLRAFQWKVGEENKFRVAHDNQNMIFRAKALRTEELKTDAGTFQTIVIKPEMEMGGIFQPTGDNYLWLTNDDRKFIVRIESKIKIGSLVSEVVKIDRGQE